MPRALVTSQAPAPFLAVVATPGMRLRLVVGRGTFDVVAFTPTQQPEEERWIHEGWARTSFSQMPVYTECLPSQRQPRVSQHPSHFEAAARRHWEEDQNKFPPEVYRWDNRLARSSVWRYPSAEERELILAFRRRHTAAIFGKKRRLAAPSEYEDARLSVLGRAPHHGFLSCAPVRRHQHTFRIVPAQFGPSFSTARRGCSQPAGRTAHSFVGFATNAQRTRDPTALPPGCPSHSFELRWWNWRGVFATPWRSAEEHINVAEWRAFLAGVAWRFRNSQNIGSRGLMLMDSAVVLAAVAKGRSSSRRLGPIIKRVNALMFAGSFHALLGFVASELNLADAPSWLH